MTRRKRTSRAVRYVSPLTIEELEAGLREMNERSFDREGFWDEKMAAFRQTVLLAIRETSNALLSPAISEDWRLELEGQLQELFDHLALAESHLERQRQPVRALLN